MRVFIGHQGNVSTLAFSPDGRYLATAGKLVSYSTICAFLTCQITGEDLAINLWDLGSGRRIKKMTGHTASIYSLAFSAESSLLVSGGADWTVKCWDIKAAGGLPAKRDNGTMANGVNGDHSNMGAKDDGNNETSVVSPVSRRRPSTYH